MKFRYYSFLCLLLSFIFLSITLSAQQTQPVNGPRNIKNTRFALVNATIFVDANTKIENGTIIINEGKIENIGKQINIPKDAEIINAKGKFIYPSFIDLYASYGIKTTGNYNSNHNTNQYGSNKNGAYAWNDAIKADVNAIDYFSYDENQSKQLLANGFAATLSGTHDGIHRGSAALVLTTKGNESDLIINPQAAAGLSFNKGSSRQDYPNSLMGSIALLRQTFNDANWYTKQTQEKNLTLQAFNDLKTAPQIFEVDNKLSVLRASKIAQEFNTTFIIKGAGDEYQRINEIKDTKATLIIPINFPKAFDVEDVFDANFVSTADLKHWEMAPANAHLLAQANINFAITSYGCNDANEFLKNLRKAVQYGLSEAAALNALTKIPAQLIKADAIMGSLQKNMLANFFISNKPIFEKEAVILEHWVKGYKTEINDVPEVDVRGNYTVALKGFDNYVLKIDGDISKPNAMLLGTDTLKASLSMQNNMMNMVFLATKKGIENIRINFWVDKTDNINDTIQAKNLSGQAQLSDGTLNVFKAIWIEKAKAEKKKQDSTQAISLGTIVYPFTDYGWQNQPVAETIIFKNATVWSNEKEGIIQETDVAISNGKIKAIGKDLIVAGARTIDAKGKHLTNGIIDEHSHIAIYRGVNECSQVVTSEVRIGDVVYSEDINIYRQLAGGVTSAQLLHGSCNPIGGQSALIKLRWGASPEKMKIEGADGFIKFALGENVKQSNWGSPTPRYPQTRMGVEQILYDEFIKAKEYEKALKLNTNTRKDLELDALVEILNKKRFISCHSYVQSEINMLMHVADSMGFKVNTFTHILEGYKLADKMKAHGVNASTFADWWAYKYEVIDAIPYNAAIMHKMGINVAINSDDAEMGRRLNQEAAKIIKYGNISEEDAWKMVTLNPAKMLHLDNKLGSIKAGKDADLVLWSNNPLSIYAKPEMTFVDGICYYSLSQDEAQRKTNQTERQRIINKMIAAKQAGEKTEHRVSSLDENYHCED
ncbi:MAG: amidohydrolase family protein [Bacteroidota bacterium]